VLNPDVWTVVVLAVGVWALYWWGQRTDDALRNQLYVQQRLLVSRGYERMADGRYRRPGAPPVYVKYEVQEVRPKVQG